MMEENAKSTPEEQPSVSTTGDQARAEAEPGQELLHELSALADRFASVVRMAWNSEQRKQLESDVRTGLTSLSKSMEEGFQQVASSNEAKELQEKASDVGEKITSSQFFADLTNVLKTGVSALNEQLEKIAADMEAKSTTGSDEPSDTAAELDTSSETQDIPIDKA